MTSFYNDSSESGTSNTELPGERDTINYEREKMLLLNTSKSNSMYNQDMDRLFHNYQMDPDESTPIQDNEQEFLDMVDFFTV